MDMSEEQAHRPVRTTSPVTPSREAGRSVAPGRLPTRVAGLALEEVPQRSVWRLVHAPTGRPLSRSAVHADPEALHDLASRVGGLAPWTEVELSVPGPRLRADLARAMAEWRAAWGVEEESGPVAVATTPSGSASPSRWPAVDRDDPERLRRIVRHLYGAVPPALLGTTVRDLDPSDRDLLLGLVAEEGPSQEARPEDTTGVIQAIRPEGVGPVGAPTPIPPTAVTPVSVPPTAVVPKTGGPGTPNRRGARGPGRAAG
jgi:hypothetical protein